MRILPRALVATSLALFAATLGHANTFELDYPRLEGALNELSNGDREAVSDAIRLVKDGEHSLALARLSELNTANPANSSLRILASYALVLAGNLVGAFSEAEQAHDAPNGNSYKCWFLAKIALLNGKTDRCERELDHARQAGDMVANVKALEAELAGN